MWARFTLFLLVSHTAHWGTPAAWCRVCSQFHSPFVGFMCLPYLYVSGPLIFRLVIQVHLSPCMVLNACVRRLHPCLTSCRRRGTTTRAVHPIHTWTCPGRGSNPSRWLGSVALHYGCLYPLLLIHYCHIKPQIYTKTWYNEKNSWVPDLMLIFPSAVLLPVLIICWKSVCV